MADPNRLEEDCLEFVKEAEKREKNHDYKSAMFYYIEAAQALLNAKSAGLTSPDLISKARALTKRAEDLAKLKDNSDDLPGSKQIPYNLELERAKCILDEALKADECKNYKEALELYSNAIELVLKVRSQTTDNTLQKKVSILAKQALDRAEELKKILEAQPTKSAHFNPVPRTVQSPAGASLTKEELVVLRATSTINGRTYVPFLDEVDTQERFAFPLPFTDKDGMVALSSKQKSRFNKWVRPSDYISEPRMIMAISCFPIRQTCVTDCSFVASIAVAAQYERRFKKRLITNIIYPQKCNGEAVYNPCGKYMVKLHLNGVPRKIIIDDYLPMGHGDELLCSFSSNRSELWVSLLEKAYMKVMGGYDFPGSNSNIDLHALTGWIPERVSMRSDSNTFDADAEFRRLSSRFHQGHCLITVATGVMSAEMEERTGLVPTHAYAVLDMQEIDGVRLLLLKNPWSRTRWKGNYSDQDKTHWTPSMQKKLNYDVGVARNVDNGVFWIDYKSLQHFFDVFYINWNPELFPFTTCVHSEWAIHEGPKKDMYSFSDNPQYALQVNANANAPVWILLTRHITNKSDFANNNEFIALVVYKGIVGRKVYYTREPEPFRDSVRINSPHCLIKMVQDAASEAVKYHIVVSQYEKNMTIQYTLRAYSTNAMRFAKIEDPYTLTQQVIGKWQGKNAAGCQNYDNFEMNPYFELEYNNNQADNQMLIEMRAPRDFAIGMLWSIESLTCTAGNPMQKMSTGHYRRGYAMLELDKLAGGKYKLIVSTFEPGQEGTFSIIIKTTRPLKVTRKQ